MNPYLYKILRKSPSALVLIIFALFLSPIIAKELTLNSINNSASIERQISLQITKNTSLEELESIKSTLKMQGFDFDYSNLVFNKNKEIISISIRYKDANNNSGNYSVASESPINDISIISNGNQISIKSQGSGNQAIINQRHSKEISKDNQITREEQKMEMEKRRIEMNKKMAARMEEVKERQTKIRARIEHERDSIYGGQQKNNSPAFTGKFNTISDNATKAELLELESAYKSENILFSYKQLERNSSDLITHITITINNGKGSITTSSFGNGKDPIKTISIGVDSKYIILKSVE